MAARFDRYQDQAGEWRWSLIAANGEIIADSGEGYVSESNLERALDTLIETIRGLDE
jgi:uncharacterized protein YegP (UPF0339 family)